MLKSILLVGLGSCAGGILRYLLSLAVHPVRTGFPLATFLTNIAGCLIIGILLGVFSRNSSESSSLCLLLTTGFCGGFTTFSTFSNDALTLLQTGPLPCMLQAVCCSASWRHSEAMPSPDCSELLSCPLGRGHLLLQVCND